MSSEEKDIVCKHVKASMPFILDIIHTTAFRIIDELRGRPETSKEDRIIEID